MYYLSVYIYTSFWLQFPLQNQGCWHPKTFDFVVAACTPTLQGPSAGKYPKIINFGLHPCQVSFFGIRGPSTPPFARGIILSIYIYIHIYIYIYIYIYIITPNDVQVLLERWNCKSLYLKGGKKNSPKKFWVVIHIPIGRPLFVFKGISPGRNLHFYPPIYHDWLVVWNHGIVWISMNFHISSPQLTFTPSFFRVVAIPTTNQI